MTDLEKQVKMLREGIRKFVLDGGLSCIGCEPDAGGDRECEKGKCPSLTNDINSLLRNLPIPLYLDTGKLTDEEIFKAAGYAPSVKFSVRYIRPRDKAIAKAARAKFVSIGELMK